MTRHFQPAELAEYDGAALVIRIRKALKNDNSGNRNPHWSKKNQKRKQWQASIINALVFSLGPDKVMEMLPPASGVCGARGTRCETRVRMSILRLVPSKRNFVRDTFENLPWTAKELRDAVKNVGLIRDDSPKWTPTTIDQAVSDDGEYWTVIRLEPLEVTSV
jgi:hypothetical protein